MWVTTDEQMPGQIWDLDEQMPGQHHTEGCWNGSHHPAATGENRVPELKQTWNLRGTVEYGPLKKLQAKGPKRPSALTCTDKYLWRTCLKHTCIYVIARKWAAGDNPAKSTNTSPVPAEEIPTKNYLPCCCIIKLSAPYYTVAPGESSNVFHCN